MISNPYKGLRPYDEDATPLFYGREALVNSLRDFLLTGDRLIGLTGASGSGKTSAVNALAASLGNEAGKWQPIYLAIEDQPLRQLAHVLENLRRETDLLSRLYAKPEALGDTLGGISANGTRLVFVLDSFENLFARVSVGERVYFLDTLFRALTRPIPVCRVCVVIRDDFRERLMEYPQWAELLNQRMITMPELMPDDLIEIIRRPAFSTGVTVETALVDRLIQDVKGLSEARLLPSLSFMLTALYEHGEMNTLAYEQLGTVSGVIAQGAETVYGKLTALQQLVARRVMLQCLVATNDSRPLARSVERARLQFNWVGAEDVNYALGQLIDAGLLTERDEDGIATLTLSHECLTQEWPRYAIWIQEEAERLRYASELELLATAWVTQEYSQQALLRGAALDEALSWMENPDNLPSSLLANYISVSSHLRQHHDAQQRQQARVTHWGGWAIALALLVVAGLLALIGLFAVGTLNERNALATQQAISAAQLVTSTAQSEALAATIDAGKTQQAEALAEIATAAANARIAATQQAEVQASLDALATQQSYIEATSVAAQAVAQSTIDGYAAQLVANVTAMANVNHLQATLDAAMQEQVELRQYLAGKLAEEVPTVLNANPSLALYLAAEAGTINLGTEATTPNPRIDVALREALKANIAASLGGGIEQSWFVGVNRYAVVSYTDKPGELWQLSPPEIVNDFPAPIEQIIPVADGRLFVVDYADETTDELWSTETGAAVAKFSGDIAPVPEIVTAAKNRNVIQLQGGAFFTVKFEEGRAGELWETATGTRKAVLNGDLERVVTLDDGYFFAEYVEDDEIGNIWQTASGQPIVDADDVVSEPYDNSIFALQRKGINDEIWRTAPFEMITTVEGQVATVTTLYGTDYFVIQYAGERPAEIWKMTPAAELVVTLKGSIDISTTYLDSQYFFVRYNDQSPSELWRTDPLEIAARLNGHLDQMNIDLTLGDEVAILAYEDNSISEVWSLPEADRLAPLTGHMLDVKTVLGDKAFVVRYDGNLPSEVWTSADGKRLARLGEGQRVVADIRTIKDGDYTVVLYEDDPAEVWTISLEGATLLTTLPDVTTQLYSLEGGDYFIANYVNRPSQIWEVSSMTPLTTLLGTVTQYAYAGAEQRLSYTTQNNQSYTLDFGTLTALSAEEVTSADLLTQACELLSGNTPPLTELAPYLGGQPPIACTVEVTSP